MDGLRLAQEWIIFYRDQKAIQCPMDTLYIHGYSSGIVEAARTLRMSPESAGFTLRGRGLDSTGIY
jgi:hypothetical protein